MAIRIAEFADAEPLASLMCELGYETRTADMQMRLESILPDPHYRTLVAVSGGKVCGMIGTFCNHSYEHNDVGGRIVALVVAEKMRGRGIGEQLLRAAEQDLIAKNIRRVAVNSRFAREEAHRFYENLGYEKNGFRLVKNLAPLTD